MRTITEYGVTQPLVYIIKRDRDLNYLYLEPVAKQLEEPVKLYGDFKKDATRFWNSFVLNDTNTGVLLTGQSGNGKTQLGNLTCNLALSHGVPVVMVKNIQVDSDLIAFLDNMVDVVIFLDEFSKNFNYEYQQKILSMLTNCSVGKRMYILTENNKNIVSEFILNRPGRARYHFDFDKLRKSVLIDYINDFEVRPSFKQDLLDLYETSIVFSFDHLQAIITEHTRYPEDTLEQLLGYLNVNVLAPSKEWYVTSITDTKTNKEVTTTTKVIDIANIDSTSKYHKIFLETEVGRLELGKPNIVKYDVEEGYLELASGEYKIIVNKQKQQPVDIEQSNIRRPMPVFNL